MPCNYYGKIIPGGDENSCVRGGGTWVPEPSLMTDPTTGQNLTMFKDTKASLDAYEKPVENLTSWLIPGSAGAKTGIKVATPYVNKYANKIVQSLFTKPGVVNKTVPILGKTTSKTTNKPVYKYRGTKKVPVKGRVVSVPKASATLIGGKGLFDMATSSEGEQPIDKLADKPVDKLADKPVDKLADKPVDKSNLFTDNKEAEKNIPDNKNKVESGLSGLWSNMQKPGYWSNKVEGGAGDWDNRLFRLGEMMSYMGTPLSKRGKNPADRWTTSAAAVSKANTAGTKATKELRDRMTKIIPNKDTLIKMFLTKKPGIIKDGKPGTTEYALAAKQAAAYAEVGHQLIMENPPIEPTATNIRKRLAELAEAKNKKNKEKK